MYATEPPEEWREIPSLPEYEASSWGRIRRRPYEAPMPHGGVRTYGGQAWPGVWEPEQRRYIFVYKGKTRRVARVVCEAFHGPPPFKGANTLHADEDSRNNRPGNLSWGTQKENLNAPGYLEGLRQRRRGRPKSKLTDEQVEDIRRRLEAGERQADLARSFGVSASHICNIHNRLVRV